MKKIKNIIKIILSVVVFFLFFFFISKADINISNKYTDISDTSSDTTSLNGSNQHWWKEGELKEGELKEVGIKIPEEYKRDDTSQSISRDDKWKPIEVNKSKIKKIGDNVEEDNNKTESVRKFARISLIQNGYIDGDKKFKVGNKIIYTFKVTNTGTVPILGGTVYNSDMNINISFQNIEKNKSIVLMYVYIITQEDIDNGNCKRAQSEVYATAENNKIISDKSDPISNEEDRYTNICGQ